ncbi:PAB-dependent poly(A)-specific ribonuclease subunit 2 [Trichinella spiralis]|uniref:PAB-dependent poly(A)-specific ribonuclease subunit 2 n=1 Tax=Trichinella spiralis TaxID=6334 RepID=UPI0001EFD096|nr:PAB-dependent poly(A)-specific ribonuclease subunit 2 [Trichinella spiralis]
MLYAICSARLSSAAVLELYAQRVNRRPHALNCQPEMSSLLARRSLNIKAELLRATQCFENAYVDDVATINRNNSIDKEAKIFSWKFVTNHLMPFAVAVSRIYRKT